MADIQIVPESQVSQGKSPSGYAGATISRQAVIDKISDEIRNQKPKSAGSAVVGGGATAAVGARVVPADVVDSPTYLFGF